ncbi:MAG: LPS-assembly protein LptD [Sphingomonadaceae bacterium]|nr:LPS-assembly protein LptD [Sphingomonadaceae bacterium]
MILLAAAPLALASAAMAQDLQPRAVQPPPPRPSVAQAASADDQVDFAAGQLEYDDNRDIVTATGDVRMFREGNRVRADRIVWNRKTGEVVADGNVAVVNPGGDTAYGDKVTLTDTLKDGVVENLLLVLADGGRLAAQHGTRVDGVTTLDNAAYTPCPVVGDDGCPRTPSWQITALRIVHDPAGKQISFKNARLHLFGLPLFVIPGLSLPLGDGGRSGLLVPDLRYSHVNGLEVTLPYYYKIASNRDLTLSPHIYTNALPLLVGQYRALTDNGAYQVTGYATYSSLIPTTLGGGSSREDFRGYIDATGRFQLDPYWSITASIRRATDRTFLKRYDISRDDRLRSVIKVERIGEDSYFSLAGWAVQTLRTGELQGQIPVALPEIDYRRRFEDPVFGGKVELQLNSLALGRTEGQDTQRAFVGARWDLRRLTPLGQEILLTAYARGDVYHSDENALTTTALYRGEGGFQGRAIAAAAAEIRWPFIGAFLGGTQRLTPRVQLVASPVTGNLNLPNEDARAVDLEDSNLFALNRFPGYDRWEDGVRVTYGFDWAYDAPGIGVTATVGQSYRFGNRPSLFPDGTGLTARTSDIVGRYTVKYRDFVSITQRFRLDKDNLAIRRNEVDATIGSARTYVLLGYLRLNRNIGPQLEDLRDREEARIGGRIQVTKYISVFGSAILDLTDRSEDPLSLADGYQPVRHRIGIAYTDECLDLGLTWKRDYDTTGDARRGNSFQLRLAFRGLGR